MLGLFDRFPGFYATTSKKKVQSRTREVKKYRLALKLKGIPLGKITSKRLVPLYTLYTFESLRWLFIVI